jgi:hypothetical protein
MKLRRLMRAALAAACGLLPTYACAVVVQLFSPADFTAPVRFSNDFEAGMVDTAQIDFLSDALRNPIILSTVSQGGTTSSEPHYLFNNNVPGTSSVNVPLVAFPLVGGVFEVGMFFGNDPFPSVVATLSVYDSSDTLIGQVVVPGNGNDNTDQFIGLRSSVPIARIALDYGATSIGEAIDDITIGAASVPLPGTLSLIGLALAGLGFSRRKRAS